MFLTQWNNKKISPQYNSLPDYKPDNGHYKILKSTLYSGHNGTKTFFFNTKLYLPHYKSQYSKMLNLTTNFINVNTKF